jgi:murein DD-endopeptidase MepM/ murein hydrolase activator NlpD
LTETGSSLELERSSRPRRLAPLACVALAGVVVLVLATGAPAQDLQSELDTKRSQLEHAEQQEGVLSSTLERYSEQIDTLAGQVATLRNREAAVQADLDQTQAELDRARSRLQELRDELRRSLKVLKERLISIYKSDEPDILTVILESDGFDDLISRYEYLRTIEAQDNAIVSRVRDLRDETRATVQEVRAARDSLAAKRDELARTRSELESRKSELDSVRDRKASALAEIQDHVHELEGDIGELENQIQAQLQAAASTTPSLPAGPIQGASSSGFIWPVNGPVVSGFGMRWGSLHAGIDIAVPAGTPIRAAASGSVAFSGWYGGYGNYTCIAHGGGLSTCYAHQSSFAATSGSVDQGQVIGYVGCTGHCFGDHLHFEVRVNGSPVDPMGYL